MVGKKSDELHPTTDQAELWFRQLMDEGKLEPLQQYLTQRGYSSPGGCIQNSLNLWKNDGRLFEDVDALDAALRREWSAQAGKAKSSWDKDK